MKKMDDIQNNEDFRMKVVNMLKIYGYYNGVLVEKEISKKYVDGELGIEEIIKSKADFKELKQSVMKVLDYCYENSFDEIERVFNYFYRVICKDVRKNYGGFFDRF